MIRDKEPTQALVKVVGHSDEAALDLDAMRALVRQADAHGVDGEAPLVVARTNGAHEYVWNCYFESDYTEAEAARLTPADLRP